MRTVNFSMMVSLDGFIADADGGLDWGLIDEELHTFVNEMQATAGIVVYGRRLWEVMESYWPYTETLDDVSPVEMEYGRIWRSLPKVVFSSTLADIDMPNVRLVRTDAATEVARLKAEDGGRIEVGGAALAASLMRADLVDEFGMWVHPVLLGGGSRMFPPDFNLDGLHLEETRTFTSGVVYLRYARAAATEA